MNVKDMEYMLQYVARQAYRMGLDDAPSIMGKRGREKQLWGDIPPLENYTHLQLEWDRVKKRITMKTEFSFIGKPLEEL